MKRPDIIALTGMALTTTMVVVAVINDNRLNNSSGKKPFLTSDQQSNLLKASLVPATLTALFMGWMFFDSVQEYKKL
jgi:hypothetical protein